MERGQSPGKVHDYSGIPPNLLRMAEEVSEAFQTGVKEKRYLPGQFYLLLTERYYQYCENLPFKKAREAEKHFKKIIGLFQWDGTLRESADQAPKGE